jgi:1-deoxy-D-xylulose-5-phosphate reductoisomerase
MRIGVSLAGSTGSIGTQAVEVVRAEPERFEVVAIYAASAVEALAAQAAVLRPQVVVIADSSRVAELESLVPKGTQVLTGDEGVAALCAAEVVVNGVVGFAGLPVTLGALRAGRRLALANKESLIAAGPVVQAARSTPGAEIVPVDSEHCALHQCLRSASGIPEVRRLVLTASGGPFRGRSADELASVRVEDALCHPTWQMGPKVTVDSSTLMNKGLEVIEAHELFGVGFDQIDVVVHPQSVVHSMVEMTDGATIAQLSLPDMRLAIGYAMGYPDRLGTSFGALDWSTVRSLDFEPPDRELFSCLGLAESAGRSGGSAPAWLSASNEVAVEAFLAGRIRWPEIAAVVAESLGAWDGAPVYDLADVLDADASARRHAVAAVSRLEVAA